MPILLFIIILAILLLYFVYHLYNNTEGFTNEIGKLCNTCSDRNFNQCTDCFNCGFCVDEWGNGSCIGGDVHGPYNYEKCARWYSGDPFGRMNWNNQHYKCEYGPKSANRAIGIYPDYANTCNKKKYDNICVNNN